MPVKADNFRKVLKKVIKYLGFDENRYLAHGLRTGRVLDLLNMGLSVETIKKLG